MSLPEFVIGGLLNPDGTLELDQKPPLAPGRVTVVLRPATAPEPPQEDWWQFMQRARRELEASGHRFMNEQEMTAWIEELRSEDDRVEQARAQMNAPDAEK